MSSKEDEDILHHVLNMIFELDDTSPLVKTLKSEGWDIFSFITEPHLAIETLNNVENVPHWQLEYISMFSEYFYYQQNHGEPLWNNWSSLTKHDFEQWISKYFPSFEKPQMHPSFHPSKAEISTMITECQAAFYHVLEIFTEHINIFTLPGWNITISLSESCDGCM